MKRVRLLGLLLSLLSQVLPAPTRNQIRAEQGVRPANEFNSPMVLTLPLQDFRRLKPWATFPISGTEGFIVDDVQVKELVLTKLKEKRGHKVRLDGKVFVRLSHDRVVQLQFDLLAPDDTVVSSWSTKRFEAEERKHARFSAVETVTQAEADQAFGGATPVQGRLRVTVSVWLPGG